jgi:hypothetical protein
VTRFALFAAALVGLLGLSTISQAEPEKKAAPSYVKEIKPFLDKYCLECHEKGKIEKSGVSVSEYRDLLAARGKKKRKGVVPGNPDSSRLLMTMEGKAKQMPPRKSPQPSNDEVKRLREWIAAGAPDDTAKTE